jgi:hypothetical protein
MNDFSLFGSRLVLRFQRFFAFFLIVSCSALASEPVALAFNIVSRAKKVKYAKVQ